jgi:hypothetical protein
MSQYRDVSVGGIEVLYAKMAPAMLASATAQVYVSLSAYRRCSPHGPRKGLAAK